MNPKVSVVVIALNEEKYIRETLDSIKSQTFKDYEIIVVDNNSTDRTSQIASKFTDKVLYEVKQGFTPARNRGFSEARGEIIIKLDADTLLDKNVFSVVVDIFEKNKKISGVSSLVLFEYKNKLMFVFRYLHMFGILMFLRLVFGHHILNGPFYAVRKSSFKKTSPHVNDTKVHEDMDLSCHISKYGLVVLPINLIAITSDRHFKSDPLHFLNYIKRGIIGYFLHHPSHKLHNVN